MTVGDLSDPAAVQKAIDEFDRIGRDAFLEKYGFGSSHSWVLVQNGKKYDSKAIVGAAHGYEFGTPLKSSEFTGGVPTVPKLQRLGFTVENTSTGDGAFIFQANPTLYDIANAVKELDKMNWLTAQYVGQIKAGRRVYIWKAGPGGGVIATGTVLTDPAPSEQQEGDKFIMSPEKFEGTQTRVELSIDRVLEEPIYRDDLRKHPVLQDLPILKFAQNTNYPITEEQDQALQQLIPGGPHVTTTLEERVSQWKDATGYEGKDPDAEEQRQLLAESLSAANLDLVIEESGEHRIPNFGKFAASAYGGPGPMSVVHSYRNTGPEAEQRLASAMHHLLYGDGDLVDRLDDVLLREDWRVPGFHESLATKALAVTQPEEWLPLFQTYKSMGKLRLMESPELGISVPDDVDDMSPGQRIKWSNDVLREVIEPNLPGDPWGQMQFLYWLRDQQPEETTSLAELAGELYMEPSWLEQVRKLLEEKKQVIFQGPPGTGKTYIARELANHFEKQGGGAEIVQFHPSYAYEDFVEGYRPRPVAGQPGFDLVQGPLMRLAGRAEADKDKDHRYVLVIDELNRGNVAKVFGELYFLLEYRGEKIRLQYSEEPAGEDDEEARFGLPRNLWIIATMNTADKSIALMDSALRRRFYFVDYYPDKPPVKGLLERWLRANSLWPKYEWLSEVLDLANKKLDDREAAIGPSHFLLRDPQDLDDERIERVWEHAVLPYLQEQLIGDPGRLKEFELSTLKKELKGETGAAEQLAPAEEPVAGEGSQTEASTESS